MTELVSLDDYAQQYGRELSDADEARLPAILSHLGELFKQEAGQTLTVETTTVRRKANGGQVWLPQHPVREVLKVETDYGEIRDFKVQGQILLLGSTPSPDRYSFRARRCEPANSGMVLVTYEHGYEEIPAVIKHALCDAARQVLSIAPEAVSGVTNMSETTGPFSTSLTFATWAQGGSTRLPPEVAALARKYRRRPPNMWVMGGSC